MGFFRRLHASMKTKMFNRKRYILNERKYRRMPGGDPRDAFIKAVHRARFPEETRVIDSCEIVG